MPARLLSSVLLLTSLNMEKRHTVYDDPNTDRQYEVFQSCTHSVLWVAEDQGVVVGSCGVYPTEGLPEGWCEIVKFYVDRHCRGKGIGRQALCQSLGVRPFPWLPHRLFGDFPRVRRSGRHVREVGLQSH